MTTKPETKFWKIIKNNSSKITWTRIEAITPVGTAATSVKMTAARELSVVVSEHAFTQGVGTVVIDYDLLAN